MWQTLSQERIELSFEFLVGNTIKVVVLDKIQDVISFDIRQYSNKINTVNRIFKENTLLDEPVVSFNLDENKKSIFSFNRILLQNIEYFKDIAFNFGYVDNQFV